MARFYFSSDEKLYRPMRDTFDNIGIGNKCLVVMQDGGLMIREIKEVGLTKVTLAVGGISSNVPYREIARYEKIKPYRPKLVGPGFLK